MPLAYDEQLERELASSFISCNVGLGDRSLNSLPKLQLPVDITAFDTWFGLTKRRFRRRVVDKASSAHLELFRASQIRTKTRHTNFPLPQVHGFSFESQQPCG